MLLYGGFSGLRRMRMQMILELLYMCVLTGYIFLERDVLGVAMLMRALCFFNSAVFVAGVPIFMLFARRLIVHDNGGGGEGIVLPSLLPYWVGSVLLSLVALAFTDADRFVMSAVLPVSAISLFHIASRINFLVKRFMGMPIIAAQPEITRIYEEGRWGELAGKIGLFTRGTFVVSLFVAGIVAIVGKDVIVILSGSRYDGAYPVLLILLATVPIAAVIAPLLMTMRSLHFMRWAVLCDLLFMAVYFGTFAVFVSIMGLSGMAVAQIAASTVQMSAAIILSKREGFYGGVGSRSLRAVVVVMVMVPLGILITGSWGLPASIVVLALWPFVFKIAVDRLAIFEPDEKKQMVGLIPLPRGRRAAAWMLTMETE
jgi:O-antigen/teichoic acid export membrane protein